MPPDTALLDARVKTKTLFRYRGLIRAYLGVRAYGDAGEPLIEPAIRTAALTMSDPADLINLAIETLMRANVELPAFSALNRVVGHLRQEVHTDLYHTVTVSLSEEQAARLDALLKVPSGESVSAITHLRESPGPATLKHIRRWTQRLAELDDIIDPKPFLAEITPTKIRQFAAEAARLQVGDLRDLSQPGNRHTLILCLLFQTQAKTRDELVEMFLRRMRQTRHAAQEQLRLLQDRHREMEEALIGVLGQVLHQVKDDFSDDILGGRVRLILEDRGGVDTLGAHIEAVSAYHGNNYLPLLWRTHAIQRSLLFRLLELLGIASTTQDNALLDAWHSLLRHRHSRRRTLPCEIDLGFLSQRWSAFVHAKNRDAPALDRRALEVCVFTHIAEALQSGDLYVPGSGAYDDYRTQLLPWEECEARLARYCQDVDLPTSGGELVATLRRRLGRQATEVDNGFPDNSELTIDSDGTPHLKRQRPKPLLFLLRYISEAHFRQSIRAETTKVESYNDFLDWIAFGGPILKSGDPVEQAKQVKYTDLVANTIMLHNVSDLTDVLTGMAAEGWSLTKERVGQLSPYTREHLRRFGRFMLDMDDLPPPLVPRSLGISEKEGAGGDY